MCNFTIIIRIRNIVYNNLKLTEAIVICVTDYKWIIYFNMKTTIQFHFVFQCALERWNINIYCILSLGNIWRLPYASFNGLSCLIWKWRREMLRKIRFGVFVGHWGRADCERIIYFCERSYRENQREKNKQK